MARQGGINVPFAKVAIFVVSAMFITMTGALMAPRFGFINPNFAFNPLVSFQVVIMAFLGGLQRLWGPILGVVPLIILSEGLQTAFPFWFSILLGLVFVVFSLTASFMGAQFTIFTQNIYSHIEHGYGE